MTTIAVTGASGFIGSALVDRLGEHADILAFARSGTVDTGVHSTCTSDLSVRPPPLLIPRCDTIVHCAASMNANDRNELWSANVTATRNMLEWAVETKCKKFIYISTGSVYGYRPGVLSKENDPLHPIGDYGHTKHIGETLCQYYSAIHGLSLDILRLYFPYGPGQRKGMFKLIADAITNGNQLTVNKNGGPYVTPTYIHDVVAAIERCVFTRESSSIYNLCGTETIGFGDAVVKIESLLGRKANLISTEVVSGDLMGDSSLLRDAMNWSPTTSVDHGLNYLVENTK